MLYDQTSVFISEVTQSHHSHLKTFAQKQLDLFNIYFINNLSVLTLSLGRQAFIEMHLVVDSDSVKVAHEITEEVESILDQKYALVRATIHIEPRSYSSKQISFGEV